LGVQGLEPGGVGIKSHGVCSRNLIRGAELSYDLWLNSNNYKRNGRYSPALSDNIV
jgi:hypothetical protein